MLPACYSEHSASFLHSQKAKGPTKAMVPPTFKMSLSISINHQDNPPHTCSLYIIPQLGFYSQVILQCQSHSELKLAP